MSIGAILESLYILVLAISLLITVIIFVVWLVLKRPAKSASEIGLITLATLSVFLGLSLTPFHDYLYSRGAYPSGQSALTTDMSAETKADLAANTIEKAEALDIIINQYPVIAPLPKALGIPNVAEAKAELAVLFDELPLKDRKRLEIVARQSILDHVLNQNSINSFDHTDNKPSKGHRKLIESFQQIVNNIHYDQTQVVETMVPDNFFRYQLLKSIYEKENQKALLADLDISHKLHITQFMQKIIASAALTALCFAGGIAASFIFKRILANEPDSQFESWFNKITAKQIYCVGLGVYFVNFLLLIPLSAISYALGAPSKLGKSLDFYILFIDCVLNIATTLGFTALIFCSPLQLKITDGIKELFSGNWLKSGAIAIGTFCILKTLAAIYFVLVYLLFHVKLDSSNPVNAQIATIAIAPDLMNTIVLWVSIAVLAPFIEEFIFRGLLYTAFKKKYGIDRATLLSAFIFAAVHRDLNSFIPILATGIALAIVFGKTKSLQACFFFHMLWNTSIMIEAWLLF